MSVDKEQLEKIAAIVEKYISILENIPEEKSLIKQGAISFGQVPSYLPNMSLLIDKNKLISLHNRKFKNLKIISNAKNIFGQILEDVDEYYNESLNAVAKVKSINHDVISNIINGLGKNIEFLYDNTLNDIFNLGRQHERLSNKNLKKQDLRKFAQYGYEEGQNFNRVLDYVKSELVSKFKDVEIVAQNDLNKKLIIAILETEYNSLKELLNNHCWKIYSFGNLQQIIKDNIQYVTWETGHYNDDCMLCRAHKTGDEILKDKEDILELNEKSLSLNDMIIDYINKIYSINKNKVLDEFKNIIDLNKK